MRKNKFYKIANKKTAAPSYDDSGKKSIRQIVEELKERGVNAELCMKFE